MAQTWPERAVKFVITLGPGAGADISARLLGDRLSKMWGQPVVIENRPGGDAMVAIGSFIAANDDYTILYGPAGSFVGHPYLHKKLNYHPRDLVPIARVSNTLISITVPTALNLNTLKDVVAYIRKDPGKHNWAGVTGMLDLIFQSYFKTNGLVIHRVPYRDGVQALNDLAEGRIQFYTSAYAIARPQVQNGKVKVVALTNSARAPILMDVPTVREAGYPAMEFDGLVGLFGRRGMPDAIIEKIAAGVRVALQDEVVKDRLNVTGQVLNYGDGKQFAASIEEQRQVAARAGAALGIKPTPYQDK
jgi:tripartite-type tricarboxylate transporter receptor subunit TctC